MLLRIALIVIVSVGSLALSFAESSTDSPMQSSEKTNIDRSDPVMRLNPQPGRYQIVVSPITARDVFLLDTETGRVWQRLKNVDLKGEPDSWEIVPRLDNEADRLKFDREYGFKPLSKKE